jgi:uncharacterized Tic20 family protein
MYTTSKKIATPSPKIIILETVLRWQHFGSSIAIHLMFHAPLTPQARHRAAICHWSGLLWFPIEIGLFMVMGTIFPEINQDLNLFFMTLFSLPAVGLFLAGLIQMMLWKGWRAKHEFIDRSGREASNFGLSAAFYLSGIVLVSLASYGLGDLLPFVASAGVIGAYLLPAMLFLHFLLAIAGGVVAWRGGYYIYPWKIHFFS